MLFCRGISLAASSSSGIVEGGYSSREHFLLFCRGISLTASSSSSSSIVEGGASSREHFLLFCGDISLAASIAAMSSKDSAFSELQLILSLCSTLGRDWGPTTLPCPVGNG